MEKTVEMVKAELLNEGIKPEWVEKMIICWTRDQWISWYKNVGYSDEEIDSIEQDLAENNPEVDKEDLFNHYIENPEFTEFKKTLDPLDVYRIEDIMCDVTERLAGRE